LIWWMLAREVLRLRGTLANRETEWDVMTDLYFYRDPESEEQKEIAEEKIPGAEEVVGESGFVTASADWEMSGGPAFAAPAATAVAGGSWDAEPVDWASGQPAAAAAQDWAAETTAAAPDAGGW